MSIKHATRSLKQAYEGFAEIIASLSDQQLLSAMHGGWSPGDVAAHLIGWNSLMQEASLSILAGMTPAYYKDAPNDYSTINAGFMKKYSSHSKQELLAELKSSFEIFEAFIHSLPTEELGADHGVFHHSGNPATVGKIIDSLESDYQHHTREIRELQTGEGT